MLDQCAIAVLPDRIQVKPELIENPNYTLDGWLLPIRCHRESDTKKANDVLNPVYHSRFDIFASDSLQVHTRSRDRTDRNHWLARRDRGAVVLGEEKP